MAGVTGSRWTPDNSRFDVCFAGADPELEFPTTPPLGVGSPTALEAADILMVIPARNLPVPPRRAAGSLRSGGRSRAFWPGLSFRLTAKVPRFP